MFGNLAHTWGKIMKQVLTVVLSAAAVVLLFFALLGAWVAYHGYSWHEMDWDDNGKITVAELLKASDIGRRAVVLDGKPCVEYFAYKDGLAVRVDCPYKEK